MTQAELKELILKTLVSVAPNVDLDEIEADENFRDQFDFDSMDFLNFVTALGKALGREVPPRDTPKLASLEGCLAYFSN
ncbi:hypothetical protein COW36_01495 [bacterium (Candidatus Blackallbacteria) CG17_big_fil_post_rev_8_21_14_2_50_48_46]|uniref:Carrier domain-containing protein n=1 Tax=bacterium (Candidatus Blackallbacteria) CG17_big_fil_post_rev_8_21_14_2_50_48_46 TaxID=2014261 RepID=A0A2M7GBM7_9BACT|nr:MAG: hypothetical protein COW64_09680 [bacterium (Candidatus Blackallbacteria) CG18_big_fil_WC_8_21_14_2_50_49_26]PIW19540.1 MAG: hypothetical protein COW36_01495 [bacterium (Candidatus Blackallbacteria) CG17_big_fil_post_rev_8_21_14_2_50_48_46]PIW48857.1 MAG: hypothetical protein COW20_06960 [bacterium (Candidatus Blackallbacteria) CG13_big_fil_rev_8_21_14_2_50_49_14]